MSPYVRALRDAVGDQLILLPAAVVLPRDEEDRLLLVRHADTGLWGLVGGAVEPGESPAMAARRECEEETGLQIELGPIVAAVGGERFEVTYGNGDRVAYVATVFEARVVCGDLRPDGVEVDAAEWFTVPRLGTSTLNPFCVNLLSDLGILPDRSSAGT